MYCSTQFVVRSFGCLALAFGIHATAIQSANAASVTVNQNIHTFLASPITAPKNKDVVFNAGGGNTVTLRFTISTQSGENFSTLDGNTRVGVGPAGPDGNHIDSSEDVTFAVKYLSHTGTVDPFTVAFRFDSIGFRRLDATSHNLSYTLNGGAPLIIPTGANGSELLYNLDTSFTTIGMLPSNYSGVFENQTTSSFGQFTSVGGAATTGGLQFSVQFAEVPEPSSMALIGTALVGMALVRRRRLA